MSPSLHHGDQVTVRGRAQLLRLYFSAPDRNPDRRDPFVGDDCWSTVVDNMHVVFDSNILSDPASESIADQDEVIISGKIVSIPGGFIDPLPAMDSLTAPPPARTRPFVLHAQAWKNLTKEKSGHAGYRGFTQSVILATLSMGAAYMGLASGEADFVDLLWLAGSVGLCLLSHLASRQAAVSFKAASEVQRVATARAGRSAD